LTGSDTVRRVYLIPQRVYPQHVLCVLGTGLDLDLVAQVVQDVGGGVRFDREDASTEPDPRMPMAFAASLTNATFTDADRAAVAAHDTVVYLLAPPMGRTSSLDESARMLALTAALLRAGATAVKSESSGITHGRERWLQLADDVAGATGDQRVVGLYRAWVKRPIAHSDYLYSCGMHLLAAPEVELVGGTLEDVPTMDEFAGYLLLESPTLHDGEGFRVAPDAPRWTIEHHADEEHPEDHFFHNPFGAWRLTPA
jgi:hypothetical protein